MTIWCMEEVRVFAGGEEYLILMEDIMLYNINNL